MDEFSIVQPWQFIVLEKKNLNFYFPTKNVGVWGSPKHQIQKWCG
jgi:hypothetical protein